jgi:hypothetical protein
MVELFILIAAGVGVGLVLTLVFWGVLTLARPILDAIRGILHPVTTAAKDKIHALPHVDIHDQTQILMERAVLDLQCEIPSAVPPFVEEWSHVRGTSLAQPLILQNLLGQEWPRLDKVSMAQDLLLYPSVSPYVRVYQGIGKTAILAAGIRNRLEDFYNDPKFEIHSSQLQVITLVENPTELEEQSQREDLFVAGAIGQHQIKISRALNTESRRKSATAQKLAIQGAPLT